jgi:hypothetical protein
VAVKRALFIVLLVNLAAALALVFIYPEFMIAPGPLIEGHETLTNDCFACHWPLLGASSQKCASCHEPTQIGLRTTQGDPIVAPKLKISFHQKLIAQDCVACHSDHEGVRKYRTSARFSHVLLGPDLRRQCESCHRAPNDRLHANLTRSCGQCHTDQRWKPATFDHGKYFELDRDHDVKCAVCHVNDDFSKYTCYGCHEHTPRNIRAQHLEEGIRDFENCVECHRNARDEPRRRGREHDEQRRARWDESGHWSEAIPAIADGS